MQGMKTIKIDGSVKTVVPYAESDIRQFVERCGHSGNDPRAYVVGLARETKISEERILEIIEEMDAPKADEKRREDWCRGEGRREAAAIERDFERQEARQ